MRIAILGPLEVRDEAGQLVQLGGPRLRALLIRLALDPGRAVAADRVAGDLWPGDGPGQAGPADSGNALQALVSRLRHAAGPGIVEHRAGGYRLAVDPDDVDAARFERLVAKGRTALAAGDPCAGAALLREALDLWRGPALVDVEDAAFAAGPVARLEELRLAATEDRIEADLALGRGAELAPEAEELATAHPLRERLRGQLMRVLYLAGRQGDALAVYEDTRRLLAERLGVDPSPALSAVHLAILRADPALGQPSSNEADPALRQPSSNGPAPAPGQPSNGATPAPSTLPSPGGQDLPARTSNLPAQLTSFVGRDEELNRVSKLLGESRLVILTGPGGTGKTRLAIEAAARLSGRDARWGLVRPAGTGRGCAGRAAGRPVGDRGAGSGVDGGRGPGPRGPPAPGPAGRDTRRPAIGPGPGQLRAPDWRGGPAGRPGAGRGARRAHPGHQPGTARRHRGNTLPGPVAPAAARRRHPRGSPGVRVGPAAQSSGALRSGRASPSTR